MVDQTKYQMIQKQLDTEARAKTPANTLRVLCVFDSRSRVLEHTFLGLKKDEQGDREDYITRNLRGETRL